MIGQRGDTCGQSRGFADGRMTGEGGPHHVRQRFESWGKTLGSYSQGSKEPLKVVEQVSDTVEENEGAALGKMGSPRYYCLPPTPETDEKATEAQRGSFTCPKHRARK